MKRTFETMRPVLQAMQERASCRTFADRPIPEEVLTEILNTALRTASGGNLQPVAIIKVTDPARKAQLRALCDDQAFIEQAAVNLVFCIDWHRYKRYANERRAPFVADRSFGHFCISFEDTICMAQTVETAAHLCGIGSCYVGSVVNYIDPVANLLKLPQGVVPVVMLSMGYPRAALKPQPKLPASMMIFDETYPDLSTEDICAAYDEKLKNRTLALPKSAEAAATYLRRFTANLATTYPSEEIEAILTEVLNRGAFNETQRRFGLHYEAAEMLQTGEQMMADLEAHGLAVISQKGEEL